MRDDLAMADMKPTASDSSAVTFEWRGAFTNDEIHALHAEAFETRLFDEDEWNWVTQVVPTSWGGWRPATKGGSWDSPTCSGTDSFTRSSRT